MAHDNELYDKTGKRAFLSLQEALHVASDVPVELKKEIFLSGEHGWQALLSELTKVAAGSCNRRAAGMLITTPYAVALGVRDGGSVLVLDSHAHGPR